jgi:hypothetical protein
MQSVEPVLNIAAGDIKKSIIRRSETKLSVQQQGSTSLLVDLLDLALPPRVGLEERETIETLACFTLTISEG